MAEVSERKRIGLMKRIFGVILYSLLLVSATGCMFEVLEEPVAPEAAVELTAVMEVEPGSKTVMSGLEGGMYYPLWAAGDEIAVFADGDRTPAKFTLTSGEGQTKASFSGNRSGSQYHALYPYDGTAAVSSDVLSLILPETQKYANGSFGPGTYPMLAAGGADSVLNFMNLCSVLKISMTGTAAVRNVTLTANDEKTFLSGPATVALTKTGTPQLKMSEGGSIQVTLDCKGLEISEDSPADVFIAIPSQTYKGGLTIEVDTYTDTVTKTVTTDLTFARSQIRTIPNFVLDSDMDDSQDGKVTTLQTAAEGNGIDIVLMGDAYSDRQIAGGLYESDMKYLYDNLFTKEPFKTHQDMFNVYYVTVVSATEGYGNGPTALEGDFGEGTLVKGNDQACFSYALNAISAERMDEALIIVAMNADVYAGTCYMYYPANSFDVYAGDYGSGPAIAYFPKGGDKETFAQLLHHEANGHGFAKLADEYAYQEMGAIPSDKVDENRKIQDSWGWCKNVDFTGDPGLVRWSHFLDDTRYDNEGLGVFLGGLTYWSGVWRPTENSIMRYNVGDFNAPSREAIYHRIHKLAYGDSWQYDYEDFVEYDAVNRSATASRAARPNYVERPLEPTAPPVIVRRSWKDAK